MVQIAVALGKEREARKIKLQAKDLRTRRRAPKTKAKDRRTNGRIHGDLDIEIRPKMVWQVAVAQSKEVAIK